MLNVLPYHLLKSIFELLDPADIGRLMSVDSRASGFINKYRDLFRKKNVLLRLKGAPDHMVLEVFAAAFSRKAPRRIKVFAHDLEKLSSLPGMSIRSMVVEGTSDSNNRLLTSALERLEVYPECSVTFKNVDFTGTDVETVRGFLGSLSEIPLLRIKECTFPSCDFASRLLNDSKIMAKTYSFEDDYSTILGSTQSSIHLGDQLLSDFLTGKGEKMSLSLTEHISWTGVTRFVEVWSSLHFLRTCDTLGKSLDRVTRLGCLGNICVLTDTCQSIEIIYNWRKFPREFTSVSFIRTAAFNDEARGADADFSRVFTSPQWPGLLLRIHMDNRVHAWISTEQS